MATYSYGAINAAGKRTKGTVEAANAAEAKGKLLQSGLAVLKLTATAGSAPSAATDKDGQTQTFNWRRFFEKKLPTGELILFTKQFRTLYTAGITLDDIFEILARQTQHKAFKTVIEDMRRIKTFSRPFTAP